MAYQYQQLAPGEIRLLKFCSQPQDSISFEVVHKVLSSKPHYAALSYTWGSPGDINEIWLHRRKFPIRPNLYDALVQLQRSLVVDQYLWVDAICIDQDALDERSVQVALMKQIYEGASKVFVWLGTPVNEANNRLAFHKLKVFRRRSRRVAQNARPYRPWWWQQKVRTSGEDIADFLQTLSPARDKEVFDVPGSNTHMAWLGIISLWQSPWWNRTWIFQESTIPEVCTEWVWAGFAVNSVSNTSKVIFLCGDQSTNWFEIGNAVTVAASITATPGIDSDFLAGKQTPVDKLMKFRLQRIVVDLPPFLDIIQLFRHTACLDPRDKVYAPLCLASDVVRRYLRPVYANKTVLDVYTDVVRYHLDLPGQDLGFLGHAMYDERRQEVETPDGIKSVLPSWVPNFSGSLELAPIPKLLCIPKATGRKGLNFVDRRGLPDHNGALIAAYKPLANIPPVTFIQDRKLHLRGVYIDTIKEIILNTGPDLEIIRTNAQDRSRQWAAHSQHQYFTGETYSDAIGRTVVLDLVYGEFSRPSERGGKIDSAFLAKPRAELSLPEYREQMNMRMAKSRANVMRNLGFSEKRFLLMIPNNAVVGDVIWALAGGQVLYILRSTEQENGQYRYIGECYAHGLMDGDILRRIHLGEAQLSDITLI